mgnify:CR=1 FL=1
MKLGIISGTGKEGKALAIRLECMGIQFLLAQDL